MYGVFINSLKCIFGVKELTFLGHHISIKGIQPLKDKMQAVQKFPPPTTQRKLGEFLGIINFYSTFDWELYWQYIFPSNTFRISLRAFNSTFLLTTSPVIIT